MVIVECSFVVADFIGRAPCGVSPYPMNTRTGYRLDAGMTYLDLAAGAGRN